MPAIMRNWSAIASISLTLLLGGLSGCSSTSPNIVPSTGPDTLTVYQNHVAGVRSEPKKTPDDAESDGSSAGSVQDQDCARGCRPLHNEDRDLAGYTREAKNEISLVFPRLPNPELVLYIFPHINGKGRPIPGYSTSFLLYEKDEYALPGEVAP